MYTEVANLIAVLSALLELCHLFTEGHFWVMDFKKV